MGNAWEQRADALATIYPRERLETRAVATIDAALGGDNAGAKSHHHPATYHQPDNGVGGDNNADSCGNQPDSHNNEVGGGNQPRGSKIALACSGGSDSIALLLLAVALFPGLRERLCVLHLDHALRGSESAGDAEFVATVARELGVESVVGKIDWQAISARDNRGRGLVASEEFLRGLRLEFFAREMRARNCKILLQGHQRSDVEELLLMRLSRGAGVGGLSAPRPVSPQSDGRIFVRPLLTISKPDIETALRSLAIPWRQDATNAGCDYFRNRVRHNVLPALAAAAPFVNIARSRMLLEEADDFLELATNDFLRSGKRLSATLPRALLRRAIIKILDDRGATISAKNLDALVESVATTNPIKFSANKDFDVCWDGGELRILKRNPATTNSPTTNPILTTNPAAATNPIFTTNPAATTNPATATTNPILTTNPPTTNPSDNDGEIAQSVVEVTPELFASLCAGKFPPTTMAFLTGEPKISVRRWQFGDAFRPLGAPGAKSLGDIFCDKKIPRQLRHALPVCVDDIGIAWIPGIPPAERFRILRAGGKALRLTYKRASLR